MHQNLCHIFRQTAKNHPNASAFFSKDSDGTYVPLTYGALYTYGITLATALQDLGFKKGNKAAIIADNRQEWIIANYGILFCGGIDVPRGSNITDFEINYILDHSEVEFLFVENLKILNRLQPFLENLPTIKHIIIMDLQVKNHDQALCLSELLAKPTTIIKRQNIEQSFDDINPEDLFTIIYTSGTMGTPKGVELTHSNMVSQILGVQTHLPIDNHQKFLSILPIWHIFERIFCYYAIFTAGQTYYTNAACIKDDLKVVQPHFLASAPRLLEAFYDAIMKKVKQAPTQKKMLFYATTFYNKHLHMALDFFKRHSLTPSKPLTLVRLMQSFKHIFWFVVCAPFTFSALWGFLAWSFNSPNALVIGAVGLLLNAFTLNRIVGNKLKVNFVGEDFRVFLSGGGALPEHIDVFFNTMNMPIVEGYGMTEMSPVITARKFENNVIGSAGFAFPKTHIQIRDDNGQIMATLDPRGHHGSYGIRGHVFAKGPQLMKGYHKNPGATEKTIIDGWLDTGDLGFISTNGTLTLKGRSKETIVLSNGENIDPVPIENKISASDFVSQCMLFGQDKRKLGAVLIPDFDTLEKWASDQKMATNNRKTLIRESKVKKLFASELGKSTGLKHGFKLYELVQVFVLSDEPFEVGKELTNLYKLKRMTITDKYAKAIEEAYKS